MKDVCDILTELGYPPVKKHMVEVKVNGEWRVMFLSDAQLEKIKKLQKDAKNG